MVTIPKDVKRNTKKDEEKKAGIRVVEPEKEETQSPSQPAIQRNETGRITGITLPDGRSFPNIGKEEALGLLENWRGKRETPQGAIEMSDFQEQRQQQQEELKRQEELLPVAEETGVFEDRPERVELGVTKEERKGKAGLFRQTAENLFGISTLGASKVILGKNEEDYKIDDLIQNPETMRAKMLQEIQREELDRVSTTSQKLGAVLEPVVGDLKVFDVDIGGYADKFTRMPMQEVDEIVQQIGELEGTISGMTDSASQGEIGNPAEVLRTIAEKEEQLAVLEARMKRLILASSELRANPEKVNIIEEKVLKARETMFEAKQRAAEGALITPTDSQLFLKLQELRK